MWVSWCWGTEKHAYKGCKSAHKDKKKIIVYAPLSMPQSLSGKKNPAEN